MRVSSYSYEVDFESTEQIFYIVAASRASGGKTVDKAECGLIHSGKDLLNRFVDPNNQAAVGEGKVFGVAIDWNGTFFRNEKGNRFHFRHV